MGVDRIFEEEEKRRKAERLHALRKLFLEFSSEVDPHGGWTMGMINSFLIRKGLMSICHHERARKATSNSPQGLRHGMVCPDCDESIFWAVGVTDGEGLWQR